MLRGCLKSSPLLLALLLLTVWATAAGGEEHCKQIYEGACLACHDTGRVCAKLGRKSRERWAKTVERMAMQGAVLSVAQKSILVDCLDRRDEGIAARCR